MTTRLLPAITLALLLSACGLDIPQNPAPRSGSGAARSASASDNLRVFKSTEHGFSILYPSRWRVRQSDTVATPDGQRTGVTFLGGSQEAVGTALLEATAQVATQPGACPAMPGAEQVIIGSRAFQRINWSEGAAGSKYDGASLATEGKGRCHILTLLTRTCNLGPDCGEGHTLPFQDSALEKMYERMVNSFTVL